MTLLGPLAPGPPLGRAWTQQRIGKGLEPSPEMWDKELGRRELGEVPTPTKERPMPRPRESSPGNLPATKGVVNAMNVLSEEKLCGYLSRVLDLSQSVLGKLREEGAKPVDDTTLDQFHALINDLNEERSNDSFLNDPSWNWIWESKSEYNFIQIYGRLAWINLQLLELL